jgi:hypothetical protein
LILTALSVLAASCATPATTLQVTPDSEALPEQESLRIALFDEDGDPQARISSSLIPSLTFIGDLIPRDEGGADIYLTALELFANWANGWTDGRYEASGRLVLLPAENGPTDDAAANTAGSDTPIPPGRYELRLEDPPKLWSVVDGEIRYYDAYYRGDDGVAKVRARVDRLQAFAAFLREQSDAPAFYPELRRGTPERPSFREETRPLLFPELTGEELPEGPVEIGADIPWSTTYTDETFPERLRPLRDSGTMFRDYEEALELFYSFYNLAYVTTALDGAVVGSE